MNLALQKRHEQLERWKQNEEADSESAQREQVQSETVDGRSSIQQINLRAPNNNLPSKTLLASSTAISTTRKSDNTIDKSSPSCSDTDSPSKIKHTKIRNGRIYDNLQVTFSKSTLFLTACTNGDLNECERLLKDNLVNIDVTTCDGLTGLHEAAICGNSQMVEWLIEHNANINCCDNEGWTPLHAAASLGQVKIVELLLEYGADATIVNCENLLAYDLARNEQVQSLIGDHLQGADIDYLRSQEERAIENDIERWIKTGHYDERSHPVTNATVLHVLAAKGHVKLMKRILESPTLKKQINLEAKDNEGFTPLLAASFWSQKEIVELLIEHNADIFALANNGYKISSIHLENYQKSKLQQPNLRTRSTAQSLDSDNNTDSKLSLSSLESSQTELSYADSEGITSGSAPRHLKQGHLLKSRSLDVSQRPQDAQSVLQGTMSVDRLLLRSESMSERDLRKSYKELVMENERLKKQLRGIDDREKQKQQDWIRTERQLQRKISELEEENRQLEQWRQDVQRLQDENSSLIRVVSKLSKKN